MAEGAKVFFEEHKESRELGRLALRGGAASVATQYSNGVLQIIASIVLARLLTPEDFGLVAIITVLTSFAPFLIDFGLGDATTQKDKITPSQVSTLFWLSSGIGVAGCGGCSSFLPFDRTHLWRTQARSHCSIFCDRLRAIWNVKPAHRALTANNAIWQNCQNTDHQHIAWSCRCRIDGRWWLRLLGARASSYREHAERRYRSVVRMRMEAGLPGY